MFSNSLHNLLFCAILISRSLSFLLYFTPSILIITLLCCLSPFYSLSCCQQRCVREIRKAMKSRFQVVPHLVGIWWCKGLLSSLERMYTLALHTATLTIPNNMNSNFDGAKNLHLWTAHCHMMKWCLKGFPCDACCASLRLCCTNMPKGIKYEHWH